MKIPLAIIFILPLISSCSSAFQFGKNNSELTGKIKSTQQGIEKNCSVDDREMYQSGFNARGGVYTETEYSVAEQVLSECINKKNTISPQQPKTITPQEKKTQDLAKARKFVDSNSKAIRIGSYQQRVYNVCDLSYQLGVAATQEAFAITMGGKIDKSLDSYWLLAEVLDVPEKQAESYLYYLLDNRDVLSSKMDMYSVNGAEMPYIKYCSMNPKNYIPNMSVLSM